MDTIHSVTLGDRFKVGKHITAKVVDLREVRSIVTGQVTGYQCIAAGEGIASNLFEVPFATVARNRIHSAADLQEAMEEQA